ncbi:hypothetical protein JCM19231_3513 [Vibrio ishigakensis]|uniref:Secreted protein n=1 Tax=Vibrio ishigakensis TaxID=1481914 RepID=A0A0B8NS75_9VIBR|nr:hypothetical protein [Vibrio ishigakensis]GAM53993.1 hypothetical protein JCM19231_3513 [Vibrio ishigakensis]
MLLISALSWVLVTLMPVINAHGSNAGVWASLCTLNGFKLVQIEEANPHTQQHAKPCPFSYFSSFHQHKLKLTLPRESQSLVVDGEYSHPSLAVRFEQHTPRAPPSLFT